MKHISFSTSLSLLILFVLSSTGGLEKAHAKDASEKADIQNTNHACAWTIEVKLPVNLDSLIQ